MENDKNKLLKTNQDFIVMFDDDDTIGPSDTIESSGSQDMGCLIWLSIGVAAVISIGLMLIFF